MLNFLPTGVLCMEVGLVYGCSAPENLERVGARQESADVSS